MLSFVGMIYLEWLQQSQWIITVIIVETTMMMMIKMMVTA
jgi:hypothetical protein